MYVYVYIYTHYLHQILYEINVMKHMITQYIIYILYIYIIGNRDFGQNSDDLFSQQNIMFCYL